MGCWLKMSNPTCYFPHDCGKIHLRHPIKGNLMTPAEIVAHVAEFLVANPEFSAEEFYGAMDRATIPFDLVDRAYNLMQSAWAYVFLDGRGIRLSPDYMVFDSDGNLLESGKLSDEPYFVAAIELGRKYSNSQGFKNLVLQSSELAPASKAVKTGSKPENLVLAPVAIFNGDVTEAGMRKAQQVLAEFVKSQNPMKPKS
jgi:hypothetical protein